MEVSFKRTGVRRYAVIVTVAGEPTRAMDPAPGYDDDIPHDLVHYVVEAELRLVNGVYGRAERGAGTFIATTEHDVSPRQRARQQRKQRRREQALRSHDDPRAAEMATSERLAAVCDVAWRRKAGQRPDALRAAPVVRAEDAARVERVVARLDALAPLWRALAVGDELVFDWPSVEPTRNNACTARDLASSMSRYPEEFIADLCGAIRGRSRPSGPTMVAVDGPACSGKSSLTEAICRSLDEPVTNVGIDSFFTPFRKQSITWSPDEDLSMDVPHLRWREIENLVLDVLPAGRTGFYRPYLWADDVLGSEIAVPATAVVLVEGLYALHPRLRGAYDLKLWVDCRRDDRMERIVKRDGTQLIQQWLHLWAPREQMYVARYKPYDDADVFVLGAGLDDSSTRQTFAWSDRSARWHDGLEVTAAFSR